jgi:hypothetical protein
LDFALSHLAYKVFGTEEPEGVMTEHSDKRFGTVALEKGFINKAQLLEALKAQIEEELDQGKHRRIGAILHSLGYLPEAHAMEVLRAIRRA